MDVDSTVELMVDSLDDWSAMGSLAGFGAVETLGCCEIEGKGSISPVTLMFVVGEIGAVALNSKALYEDVGSRASETGYCG